ncbi:MAG: sodium:calcium antiporter, partial [Thermoguttaceae bacterium]|nr:sodium:calcium antiporter [Thermoguttaceae bacterium]
MLLLNIVVLIAGFFALIKGADVFVDGSAALAKNFKIPTLIIGLTVAAMGTSAPELAVCVSAGLQGAIEIAFSNVVGSNLFNLLVVLGVCAVISP